MQVAIRLFLLTLGTLGFLFAGSSFLRTCGSTRVFEAKNHPLLKNDFALIAINGGSQEKPENTPEAFNRARDMGAWLNVPLRLTRDNKLIVFKDSTLERTTTGKGFVRNFTLEEIRSLKAETKGGSEKDILTFDEVLAQYPNTPVWVELLDNSLPAAIDIVNQVEKSKHQERFVFTSPNFADLSEVRRLQPDWVTASPDDEAQRLSMLSSLHLESVGTIKGDFLIAPLKTESISILSKTLVDEAHKRFKRVIAWNLNDEVDIKRALEMNVDGIATEKPELLRGIIGSSSKK